mmetsp:Transcript_5224/g.12822  ORF Transcript_5224/g.12822 Transcript_5224/m.12822 type:complete len:373 (+) Transcript_5224:2322-3440(+)
MAPANFHLFLVSTGPLAPPEFLNRRVLNQIVGSAVIRPPIDFFLLGRNVRRMIAEETDSQRALFDTSDALPLLPHAHLDEKSLVFVFAGKHRTKRAARGGASVAYSLEFAPGLSLLGLGLDPILAAFLGIVLVAKVRIVLALGAAVGARRKGAAASHRTYLVDLLARVPPDGFLLFAFGPGLFGVLAHPRRTGLCRVAPETPVLVVHAIVGAIEFVGNGRGFLTTNRALVLRDALAPGLAFVAFVEAIENVRVAVLAVFGISLGTLFFAFGYRLRIVGDFTAIGAAQHVEGGRHTFSVESVPTTMPFRLALVDALLEQIIVQRIECSLSVAVNGWVDRVDFIDDIDGIDGIDGINGPCVGGNWSQSHQRQEK